ncbi:MAG: fasciclin domain-containing protein [Alphaproteobacteria bacterium]|nr:fasciclin domain-containing protein [Alphaproteobacteria bacterium]
MTTIANNRSVAWTAKTVALAGILLGTVFGFATPDVRAADLHDELNADNRLSLFANAVERSGMADILKGEGPYILLVPSNRSMVMEGSAFLLNGLLLTPSNAERLKELVSHHILEATAPTDSADVITLQRTSLNIAVMGDARVIDGRAVVTERKVLDNGVLYVIDRLLMPEYQRNF